MKRFTLSVLSILLVLSFVSCGKKEGDTTEPEAPGTVQTVTNEQVLENIANARKMAVDAGAETDAANQLASVDEMYDSVKADAEAEKNIVEKGTDVANRYLSIATYLKAKDARAKLENTDMTGYANVKELYDQGCQAMDDTEALFNKSDATGKQILDKSTEAATCLNSALAVMYKKIAKDERLKALNSKKDADSVKAAVTEKTSYQEAVDSFKKADQQYSMQDSVNAYENYKKANEIFTRLFETVTEKRAAAQKAIEEAKKSVQESEELAETADVKVPLTEQKEGIEAEDAVLLEPDNYGNPEDAEIELSDEVSDPVQDKIEQGLNSINDDRNAK